MLAAGSAGGAGAIPLRRVRFKILAYYTALVVRGFNSHAPTPCKRMGWFQRPSIACYPTVRVMLSVNHLASIAWFSRTAMFTSPLFPGEHSTLSVNGAYLSPHR